jgi:hypothetical protein
MSNPRSGSSLFFELPARTFRGIYAIERALTRKPKVARKRELSAAEFQDLLRLASFTERAARSADDIGHATCSQLLAYLTVLLRNTRTWRRVFPRPGRGTR